MCGSRARELAYNGQRARAVVCGRITGENANLDVDPGFHPAKDALQFAPCKVDEHARPRSPRLKNALGVRPAKLTVNPLQDPLAGTAHKTSLLHNSKDTSSIRASATFFWEIRGKLGTLLLC
jgi:hypothetical protein